MSAAHRASDDDDDDVDLFDAVESLSAQTRRDGYEEGMALSAEVARAQGRQLAQHHAHELGRELAYYRGAVALWRCVLFPGSALDSPLCRAYALSPPHSERVVAQIERELSQLDALWRQIPLDPSLPELTDVADRIRAKFRRVRSLVGPLGRLFPSFATVTI